MVKIAAFLLLGIGVGLGFAYWQSAGQSPEITGPGFSLEDRAPLERRLSELETSLALERFERQALADELDAVRLSLESIAADAGGDAAIDLRERFATRDGAGDRARDVFEDRVRERFPDGLPQNAQDREQFQRQRQLDRYVEAGLSPDRAAWIMQREEELEMEVLRARYEARQNGATDEEVANLSQTNLLRQELGDADYEKYLEGRGRPTTINVRDVLPNSPAEAVGLQPGDEIVAYDGKRVFEIGELTAMTNESKLGQTVALEVVRDGQTMQVYVGGGPIGVSGGGRPSARRGR